MDKRSMQWLSVLSLMCLLGEHGADSSGWASVLQHSIDS